MIEFQEFPKIARLSRECTITEKIDGSNGQVFIRPALQSGVDDAFEVGIDTQVTVEGQAAFIRAGSRSRWLGQGGKDDNFNFGAWVTQHAHELAMLGFGHHFGEWWGSGIQRGYGLPKGEKRFSLFNTYRWGEETDRGGTERVARPACCHVVPVLYRGVFDQDAVDGALLRLASQGSLAAPGFMGKAEGVIIYHHAANLYFKKTLDKDEEWKGKAAA